MKYWWNHSTNHLGAFMNLFSIRATWIIVVTVLGCTSSDGKSAPRNSRAADSKVESFQPKAKTHIIRVAQNSPTRKKTQTDPTRTRIEKETPPAESVASVRNQNSPPLLPNPKKMSEREWRARLTEQQFKILRKQGTEPAFSGALLNEKREGIYHCAGCGQPLYDAATKFDSGTGWPSFFDSIEDGVARIADHSHRMVRVELVCGRCGGHLGHVFDDGPKPTGERHCINSEALQFAASPDGKNLQKTSK